MAAGALRVGSPCGMLAWNCRGDARANPMDTETTPTGIRCVRNGEDKQERLTTVVARLAAASVSGPLSFFGANRGSAPHPRIFAREVPEVAAAV